jgi:hypothetical protein
MAFATRVIGADFDELTRSKLKIFLSVDIVGSTALKQRGRVFELPDGVDEGPEFVNGDWLRFLTSFYKDFPYRLVDAFGDIRDQRAKGTSLESGRSPRPPLLWKALGDELIFSAELRGLGDAALHLEALATAINTSVGFWTEASCPLPVSFKGTAWVAGFPLGNSEIPMTAGEAGRALNEKGIGDDCCDYSGPAMDIGFRLAKFATPRRLIISAELADLVISDGRLRKGFRVEEPAELKGVLRGRPYPVFWFDCYSLPMAVRESELALFEDQMFGRTEVTSATAASYLAAWFKTVGEWECYSRPFIFDLPDHGDRIPADYNQLKAQVVDQLRRIYKPTEAEEPGGDSSAGDAKAERLASIPPPANPERMDGGD